MVFEYLVKHNGIYYQAGEDVPIEEKAVETLPPSTPVEEVAKKPIMVEKPKSKGGRPKKTEV